MTDNLPVPATPGRAAVRIGRVTPKRPSCAGCAHFKRRDQASPWPIAGVSEAAEGRCGARRLSHAAEGQWRCGSDWCDLWQAPGERQRPAPPETRLAPDRGIGAARRIQAERDRLLRGARP